MPDPRDHCCLNQGLEEATIGECDWYIQGDKASTWYEAWFDSVACQDREIDDGEWFLKKCTHQGLLTAKQWLTRSTSYQSPRKPSFLRSADAVFTSAQSQWATGIWWPWALWMSFTPSHLLWEVGLWRLSWMRWGWRFVARIFAHSKYGAPEIVNTDQGGLIHSKKLYGSVARQWSQIKYGRSRGLKGQCVCRGILENRQIQAGLLESLWEP